MKTATLMISTYRPKGNPEIIEAIGPGGEFAVLVESKRSLAAHLEAAELLMLKMGYSRSNYAIIDGISMTDTYWRFKLAVPHPFPPERTAR